MSEKLRKITKEELSELQKNKKYKCAKQELLNRINYMYLKIDGTYDIPNSFEGDIIFILLSSILYGDLGIDKEWVSVEDRLPEERATKGCLSIGHYLVTDGNFCTVLPFYSNGKFMDCIFGKPTHWMLLLSLPEEVKQ